jgi:hypothetical protein
MIGRQITTLAFEEPIGAAVPTCLPIVASACWVGFRLLTPPAVNLENVVIGCKRLPQFKDARRSTLMREIRWHFGAKRVRAFGDECGLHGWVERWTTDATLRHTVMAHPAFDKWQAGLLAALAKEPLVALAEEGTRSCYGAIRGEPWKLQAFHQMMEEGF